MHSQLLLSLRAHRMRCTTPRRTPVRISLVCLHCTPVLTAALWSVLCSRSPPHRPRTRRRPPLSHVCCRDAMRQGRRRLRFSPPRCVYYSRFYCSMQEGRPCTPVSRAADYRARPLTQDGRRPSCCCASPWRSHWACASRWPPAKGCVGEDGNDRRLARCWLCLFGCAQRRRANYAIWRALSAWMICATMSSLGWTADTHIMRNVSRLGCTLRRRRSVLCARNRRGRKAVSIWLRWRKLWSKRRVRMRVRLLCDRRYSSLLNSPFSAGVPLDGALAEGAASRTCYVVSGGPPFANAVCCCQICAISCMAGAARIQ